VAKIQDKNRFYDLLRVYVDVLFKSSYRRVEYHGLEKIPKDGAIIYAPNHVNTLMDALAVLVMDNQDKVFVARADIFKNPTILKFLTFLKMLPINRKRDGIENLVKNEEINDIVVDVLRDQVPFCIFPEGTHSHLHGLLPLVKGIFRIALQAHNTFGDKMPLYLVPVGIEYGHFYRYRSSLLVQIGEPINVSQFVTENPDLSVPQQMNALRDQLSEQLKKVILYIPNDANYQATWELSQLYGKEQHKRLKLRGDSLINRFIAVKETIRNVISLLTSDPQKSQPLVDMTADFSRQRHAHGIGINSVLSPHIRWTFLGRFFLLLLGFPLFVFAAVATSPVTLSSVWLCSKFKDKAFHNTVRYLIALALLPVFLLLTGITLAIAYSSIWGALLAILFIPFFFFVHEYTRLIRLFISDTKWLMHKKLHKLFKQIILFKQD